MQTDLITGLDTSNFTPKDLRLISIGLKMARNSKDKLHGVPHIKTLINTYKQFKKDNSPKVSADDQVMAHSIVFHDSFKTVRDRSRTTLGIMLEEAYEGFGSYLIFRREALRVGLEKNLLERIAYAIRKHSIGNLFPRRGEEAKILFDLDELDSFEVERYIKAANFLKFSIDTQLRVAVSHIKMRSKLGFYFDWSRAIFEKKKSKFLEGLFKVRDTVKKASEEFKHLTELSEKF